MVVDMKEDIYEIRAHHGMCMCFFQGKGYSDEFTEHMTEIIHRLVENPPVRIVDRTDIICDKCPNNQGGICRPAGKVAGYDRQVLVQCGLTAGAVLPFAEFQARVQENIISRAGKREEICGDCQWSSLCK